MIVGLKRKDLDAVEVNSLSTRKQVIRPRDAASIILIDDSGAAPLFLLGKRRADLAFMPGQFVFPGGRTDAADRTCRVGGALAELDRARIFAGCGSKASVSRVNALAVTALRECYEETGLLIGTLAAQSAAPLYGGAAVTPDVSGLRYFARAITPPGRVRRFDTRFFATFARHVAGSHPDGIPHAEFSELRWAAFAETAAMDLPAITRTVLEVLSSRLESDPALSSDSPVPEFRMRHGRFVREWRA